MLRQSRRFDRRSGTADQSQQLIAIVLNFCSAYASDHGQMPPRGRSHLGQFPERPVMQDDVGRPFFLLRNVVNYNDLKIA